MSEKLDEILGNMMTAMESSSFWDAEAYALQAQTHLDSGGSVSSDIDIAELTTRLANIVATAATARESDEATKAQEEEDAAASEVRKRAIINEIVNFKA